MNSAHIARRAPWCQHIKMKLKNAYHHGNLKAGLLSEAHRQLELRGYETLSLRALAAAAGVAPSAPYNHFNSRGQILAALIADGSRILAARYETALNAPGTAMDRLELACLEHLSFANERPGLFRLMFVANIDWEQELNEPIENYLVAFPVFEKLIAATISAPDVLHINAKALAVWAMIHGMALLNFNGRLWRRYSDGQSDLSVIRAVLRHN